VEAVADPSPAMSGAPGNAAAAAAQGVRRRDRALVNPPLLHGDRVPADPANPAVNRHGRVHSAVMPSHFAGAVPDPTEPAHGLFGSRYQQATAAQDDVLIRARVASTFGPRPANHATDPGGYANILVSSIDLGGGVLHGPGLPVTGTGASYLLKRSAPGGSDSVTAYNLCSCTAVSQICTALSLPASLALRGNREAVFGFLTLFPNLRVQSVESTVRRFVEAASALFMPAPAAGGRTGLEEAGLSGLVCFQAGYEHTGEDSHGLRTVVNGVHFVLRRSGARRECWHFNVVIGIDSALASPHLSPRAERWWCKLALWLRRVGVSGESPCCILARLFGTATFSPNFVLRRPGH
jgi:hypothetical protein